MINTVNKKLKFPITIWLKIKFVHFYSKTLFIQDESRKNNISKEEIYLFMIVYHMIYDSKSLFIYIVLKWTDMRVGLINKNK